MLRREEGQEGSSSQRIKGFGRDTQAGEGTPPSGEHLRVAACMCGRAWWGVYKVGLDMMN